MKLGHLFALPLAFACCFVSVSQAEEHGSVVVKEKDNHGNHEFKMKVTQREGRHYGTYNNREYALRGDAWRNVNTDGEYVVTGDIDADNTYIETREARPVVVRERERVIEEPRREVIIEKRDPLIKVGPLEIGR